MILFRRHIFNIGLLVATLLLSTATTWAAKPRLVVNIVVGGMRGSDIERYYDNFGDGGFRRLVDGGLYYSNTIIDYLNTSTAAGLATLSTGTIPAVHGVIGDRWWNYTDSSLVALINDNKAHSVRFSTGSGNYSPHRLYVPTIGDMLISTNAESKQVSIAIDPLSAIVINGRSGVAYWAENNRTHWTTSSAYIHDLPKWVESYNEANTNRLYTLMRWTPLGDITKYHNLEVAVVEGIKGKSTRLLSDVNLHLADSEIGRMRYTPAGNTQLLEFASSVMAHEELGKDSSTDILNIVLDTPRYIASTYGPESIEYEDMLYRLDSDLAEFLFYIYAQVSNPEDIVVVLSSDHGTSPSYNPVGGKTRDRFNTRQMAVIVNAFLGAHYGTDDYVLGFANNSIYLNHTVIRSKRLSIDTIREEVATFMLQLRGVANAISTTSLRNSSFAEGRSHLMQQSYSPTRSGDVMIDLLPGWIIEDSELRSASDGGYNYDRHIPLVIYGGGLSHAEVDSVTSSTAIAPTLCHIMGIDSPWATESEPLKEATAKKSR
ncbi:MAG: alkaline phosphatase family protein [Alistipes sp.]|nr:alkaline phosphatase family protein [Alistipes sp.]